MLGGFIYKGDRFVGDPLPSSKNSSKCINPDNLKNYAKCKISTVFFYLPYIRENKDNWINGLKVSYLKLKVHCANENNTWLWPVCPLSPFIHLCNLSNFCMSLSNKPAVLFLLICRQKELLTVFSRLSIGVFYRTWKFGVDHVVFTARERMSYLFSSFISLGVIFIRLEIYLFM